jgi:hypothetical protein
VIAGDVPLDTEGGDEEAKLSEEQVFYEAKLPEEQVFGEAKLPEEHVFDEAKLSEEHVFDEDKLSEEQVFDQDPALSASGEEDAPTDIAAQFLCRICDKPQSVRTQPTATFCGHLFCYK